MAKSIFTITSATKRRAKILKSTDSNKTSKERYKCAYDKVMALSRRTNNPIIKLKAKSDAAYFKRRFMRFN